MSVAAFDHVAIPIQNVEAVLAFYQAIGFTIDRSNEPLFYSAHLATQKINFHGPELWQSSRFTLKGPAAKPGCGDFCFVWDGSSDELANLLSELGCEIIEGPVSRSGGREAGAGVGTSTYVRDPDGNLVEFMRY